MGQGSLQECVDRAVPEDVEACVWQGRSGYESVWICQGASDRAWVLAGEDHGDAERRICGTSLESSGEDRRGWGEDQYRSGLTCHADQGCEDYDPGV